MKSILLTVFLLIGFTGTMNAQDIAENSIGLRFGASNGLGIEISYQRAILERNRMEVNFGWKHGRDYNGIKAAALFQWILAIHEGFNWYFGAGAGFAAYNFEVSRNEDYNSTFPFFASNIGIEYKFDFPLLLSFDVRPELSSRKDYQDNSIIDLDFDVGLSARYTF